ncbi:MAG TPA: hypothetical protein VGR43_05345, partial [Dehalococcoidia bacterium]|nr:hypothetical protein [Dehalococcoidia bacterium]
MIIAVLGGAAVFVSIFSLLMWAVSGRVVSGEARLKQLTAPPRAPSMDSPFNDRVIVPVLDGFTRMIVHVLPQSFVL